MKVVALGGGHGLAVSLRALKSLTSELTAVVTVGDDGGSSGVLRRDHGVLPPGDLRMALVALADETNQAQLWSQVVAHRFDRGDLTGHPVGNVLLVALMEIFADPVAALDHMGTLLNISGRVLPMCIEPVEIVAGLTNELQWADPISQTQVRGQVALAQTPGRVVSLALEPAEPAVSSHVLEAIAEADVLVLGPGSWFSSVLPHLLVPAIRAAIAQSSARKILTLNLVPQSGETSGFSPANHVEVLAAFAPELTIDYVLADPASVTDVAELNSASVSLGASVVLLPIARADLADGHDVALLASAYDELFARGRI